MIGVVVIVNGVEEVSVIAVGIDLGIVMVNAKEIVMVIEIEGVVFLIDQAIMIGVQIVMEIEEEGGDMVVTEVDLVEIVLVVVVEVDMEMRTDMEVVAGVSVIDTEMETEMNEDMMMTVVGIFLV